MKLISCHITGYGSLKNHALTFQDGVTPCLGENGTGKTTVASFLKAMFYGLKTAKSNDKEFNDRAHFYPFDGGTFGGNLTFKNQGKTYRIERTFDVKSEAKDKITVYKDGAETDEFSDVNLGVYFFFGWTIFTFGIWWMIWIYKIK